MIPHTPRLDTPYILPKRVVQRHNGLTISCAGVLLSRLCTFIYKPVCSLPYAYAKYDSPLCIMEVRHAREW
jgi:hypothetical protein